MLPSLRVAHIYQSSAGLLVCILLIPQVARRTHPSPFPAEPQTDPSTQSNRTRRTCIRLRGQSERERSKIQLGRNRHMWDDTEELRLGEEIKKYADHSSRAFQHSLWCWVNLAAASMYGRQTGSLSLWELLTQRFTKKVVERKHLKPTPGLWTHI